MCIKFDSNLVYYLLSAYFNIDFIYFETKQFNHKNKLIRCVYSFNYMFCS